MTDSPNPSDPRHPLPAWMTLPGSLAQSADTSADGPQPTEVSEPVDAIEPQEVPEPADAIEQQEAFEPADEPQPVEVSAFADAPELPEVPEPAKAPRPAEASEPADVPRPAEVPQSPDSAFPTSAPDPAPEPDPHPGPASAERGTPRDAGAPMSEEARGPLGPEPSSTPAPSPRPEAVASPGAADFGTGDQAEERQRTEGPTLQAALEAILLVVDEPVAEVTLAQVLERPTHEVAAALRGLSAEYTASGRGFDLREVAGGWRFYTRADCAALVERFVRDGQQSRLTQAALETLAVVAYRQPVSRARVAAVRGVNSDGVMRTLVARGLVEEAGTDPESQAVLYRTSSYFLERLGLRDLSELPELAPFLPDDVENLEETTK